MFSLALLWADALIERPDATSPDRLKVENFKLRCRSDIAVGVDYAITFRLRNVTDHALTFHPQYGVFVGARRGSTNIDFGHTAKRKTLQPGDSVGVKGMRRFESAGTYRFWPAYHVNGHWGPYRWNEIVVNVTN